MSARAPVQAPPAPVQVGSLLTAARVVRAGTTADTTGGRWQAGGTAYEPLSCAPVRNLSVCDDVSSVVRDRDAADGRALVTSDPVLVEVEWECMTVGAGALQRVRQAASDALARELTRAVEHELWTGGVMAGEGRLPGGTAVGAGRARRLAVADAVVLDDVAVTPTGALSLLEQALAEAYGHGGTLHASVRAGAYLPQVTRTGNVFETRRGTRVAVGVGYPGTGPTGQVPADGEQWVYATPPVTVELGDEEGLPGDEVALAATMDRTVNRYRGLARQLYAVTWDGCDPRPFAVRMQTKVE